MGSALAATVASQPTVWCIVFGLFLTTTVIEAQQFTIEPESVVQAEGLPAEFECGFPGAIDHAWFVNGAAATSLTSEIRVAGGTSDHPSVLTIPAITQFNNSVLRCLAIVSVVSRVFSRNATLKVERVSVDVLNDKSNITVSVINNFTPKNLTYRVDISNEMITLTPLNGGQSQVQFTYEQTNNHTVCDIFSFTVTPITSESGMEGRSSEPVTGFFTGVTDNNNVAPRISQGRNVSRKTVHLGGMVPNCTNFTSYQVTSDISPPINKTIEDPQMINVSLPTDRIINISVTLTSITGVLLIFKDMLIRTTDIQNLIVDVCPNNCARIEYVEGTLSPGALLCVIRIIDGELDFPSMRLVPIRQNMSDNFTIPVAVSGNYSVIAFDLENNNMSVPRMPMSVAADDETMFLSNESSTVPNSEGITVTKLSNGSAEVTCTTTGQSCLALFQSKTSLTSLDPMVMIGFIEPPNDRTTVTLNATSDVYVVVYTWNSDSGETIFDGKVSFISQLELPTSPPPTQSPPDTTGSPAPLPILVTVPVAVVLVIAIIVCVVLYLVKRYKRRNYKVVYSSYNHRQFESNSQGRSTNTASHELHQYILTHNPFDKVIMKDSSKVGYSKEDNDKLKPVVPQPVTKAQGKYIPVETKPASSDAKDVGASITLVPVAIYDVACPDNMSLECNTDDRPPPGYDVICKNIQSPEYETIPLALAGKAAPTTSENPPPLSPPIIRGDEGLENDGVLTEETTSTSQAKDERTEDGGDDGLEAMITAQHQYTLVVPKPASSDTKVKDSSKVIYSEVDKDKLKPPPVAEAQGQYTLVETKPASSDAKVMDSTKVVYAMVDKDKLKPVASNNPPDQDAKSYPTAVEDDNRQTTEDYAISDESIQASVQGNESKAVPPTQEINDLSNPQVVAPLPIDESNQLSVKESENDKNRSENNKNQSKLGDTQLGDNQSRIAPLPNCVTPILLQDAVTV